MKLISYTNNGVEILPTDLPRMARMNTNKIYSNISSWNERLSTIGKTSFNNQTPYSFPLGRRTKEHFNFKRSGWAHSCPFASFVAPFLPLIQSLKKFF